MDALTKTKTCTGHEEIITALDSKRSKGTECLSRKKFSPEYFYPIAIG